MGSLVNAQEAPVDIQEPVAIETTLEAQPDQIVSDAVGTDAPIDTPPLEGGVVVDVRDDKRLEIMAFQSLSYESTGEYTQVKNAEVVDGDVIGFEASMVGVVEPTEEIRVYEGPCGKGWQLIIRDPTQRVYEERFDDKGKRYQALVPIERSYGYGCEHTSRTYNW